MTPRTTTCWGRKKRNGEQEQLQNWGGEAQGEQRRRLCLFGETRVHSPEEIGHGGKRWQAATRRQDQTRSNMKDFFWQERLVKEKPFFVSTLDSVWRLKRRIGGEENSVWSSIQEKSLAQAFISVTQKKQQKKKQPLKCKRNEDICLSAVRCSSRTIFCHMKVKKTPEWTSGTTRMYWKAAVKGLFRYPTGSLHSQIPTSRAIKM